MKYLIDLIRKNLDNYSDSDDCPLPAEKIKVTKEMLPEYQLYIIKDK